MITQYFSVKIDGVSITDTVKSASCSYSLGRVWNTAEFVTNSDPKTHLNKSVEIVHQDNTFLGIVVEYSKVGHSLYNVVCRSLGGKMAQPYFVDSDGVADASTASGLASEYSSKAGVPIDYRAVDFDFGGSWKESGTPDDELIKMASVIGADVYDNGTGIVIENVKPVKGSAKEILDGDLVNAVQIGDTVLNNGLGFVTTKTSNYVDSGDDDGDVIARDTIVADIDGYEVSIYPSPYGGYDTVEGVSIYATGRTKECSTSKMMNGDRSIETDCSIQSVKSVTLNGTTVTGYHYTPDTNKVFFDTPKYGRLVVNYTTKYDKGKIVTNKTPDGDFYHIKISKGNQIIDESGFIEKKDDYNSSTGGFGGTGGDKYYIPDGTDYVKGFRMYIADGVKYDLYDGATKTQTGDKIRESAGSFKRLVPVSVEKQDDGTYRVYVADDANIIDVRSAGSSIQFTTGSDSTAGKYVQVSQWYPKVELFTETNGKRLDIKYPLDEETQTLVLDDEIEIDLVTEEGDKNWDDPASFPCGYPADFPFNIPQLLNIGIEDCEGKTIVGMNGAIGSDGYCYANITQDGIYKYDTSHLVSGSSITLRANSNGTLDKDGIVL